jgi:predicted phosphodiesterase
MTRPALSLLVLSDIHFGALAEHRDFALAGTDLASDMNYAVSMRAHVVDAIKAAELKIDVILVPGDLTSAACPNEFEACWKVIEGFAIDLGVPKDGIYYTYGNHDCNWRISRLAEPDGSLIADEAYKNIASHVGDFFCVDPPAFGRGPVPGSGVARSPGLDLFIVNSGYFCSHDQVLKHGKLGVAQLDWLRGELANSFEPDRWRLLMLHHHSFNYRYPVPVHDLTFLEEGDALIELLSAHRVDMVCHGHRHHPILKTRMESGWMSPITFLCAGSVAVNSNHRASGHIPNLFHVVRLEQRHPESRGALGTVHTFRFTIPNGWVLNNEYSPTVPFDPIHHFGSVISQEQRRDLMSKVVKTSLGASTEKFVQLPGWEDLPLDLRYATLQATNDALSEAVALVECELFQRYPEQPVVVRPSQ